jgi:hypothetical protein
MTAMVAAHSGEPMGKVATFQKFFYNLSNNELPESILSFITLIVYLYKLLKVINDALALFRRAITIYAQLFCHFGQEDVEVF